MGIPETNKHRHQGDFMKHAVRHKKEAYWFYRFLSVFYDNYVNPFFWTERMRDEALTLANLVHPDLEVLDVGAGTGFTTLGIVQHVNPQHVTLLDQSPHQLAKAKKKPFLQGCTFLEGDAEMLPFPENTFDRYISAGSIEYWPDPQTAIREAFRVLKPGGIALMIGPLRPENRLTRWLADTWMLFPAEEDYWQWFQHAGFENIRRKYVRPHWVTEEKYGIAISGIKPGKPSQPLRPTAPPLEHIEQVSFTRRVIFLFRLLVGMLSGFMFIPIALFGYTRGYLLGKMGKSPPKESYPLTRQQLTGILILLAFLLTVIIFLLNYI